MRWFRQGEARVFIGLRYLPRLAALDTLGQWHWRRIVFFMLALGPGSRSACRRCSNG